jgi:hypothetical protein
MARIVEVPGGAGLDVTLGRWRLGTYADELVLVEGSRRVSAVTAPDLARDDRLTLWVRDDSVLVFGEHAATVVRVNLSDVRLDVTGKLTRLDLSGRYDPGGLHHVQLVAFGSRVLVLTEAAVALVSDSGAVMWSHVHGQPDLALAKVEDGVVCLEGEDSRVRLSLETGANLPP